MPLTDFNQGGLLAPRGTGSAQINAQRAGQQIQNERPRGLLSRISGGVTDISDRILQYLISPEGQIATGLLSAGAPRVARPGEPQGAGSQIGPAIQDALNQVAQREFFQAQIRRNEAQLQQGQRRVQSAQTLANGNIGFLDAFTGEVVDTGHKAGGRGQILNLPGIGLVEYDPVTKTLTQRATEDIIREGGAARAGAKTEAEVLSRADAEAVVNAPKELAGAQATISKIDSVLEEAGLAQEQVGPITTGFIGDKLKGIAGTDAFALAEKIKTIQANLGFKELQEMRANSPTGGALGQVSERELSLLEAALVSLNQANKPGEVKRALSKVITHYENWKEVIRQSQQSITTGVTEGVASRAQEAINAL